MRAHYAPGPVVVTGDEGQLHRTFTQKGPSLGYCSLLAILKLSIIFEQEAPAFSSCTRPCKICTWYLSAADTVVTEVDKDPCRCGTDILGGGVRPKGNNVFGRYQCGIS